MYKKFIDYQFREIVGKFVLMRNTDIVKDANKYLYIDNSVEDIKKMIIEDTKNYYKDTMQYNEELDFEDTFSIDALNEEMTTRKVTDLYEPIYGYVGIEKKRGFVLYLLGNEEDKLKYVYSPTYWSCDNEILNNMEIEIIEEEDYEHARVFKEQIQDDEELDEDVIKTREIKELDLFRLKVAPDFVSCIVVYKNANYTAKVKLQRLEQQNIYAKYHEQEGTLKLVNNNDNYYLLFIPTKKINEEFALKEYVSNIIYVLNRDFGLEEKDAVEFLKEFQSIIEKGYISGDLPFETILKIWDELSQEE